MPAKIQRPDLGAALQRLLNIQGRLPLELEQFVIPTIQVAELSEGAASPVTGVAVSTWVEPAVVGEQATWRFEVPPGTLAELLWMELDVATTAGFRFKFPGNAASIAALATSAITGYLDGRVLAGAPGGTRTPAAVITHGTLAGNLGNPIMRPFAVAATPTRFEFPPGTIVGTGDPTNFGFAEFQYASANTVVNSVVMAWREHAVV